LNCSPAARKKTSTHPVNTNVVPGKAPPPVSNSQFFVRQRHAFQRSPERLVDRIAPVACLPPLFLPETLLDQLKNAL
jgi:hypothetical protein